MQLNKSTVPTFFSILFLFKEDLICKYLSFSCLAKLCRILTSTKTLGFCCENSIKQIKRTILLISNFVLYQENCLYDLMFLCPLIIYVLYFFDIEDIVMWVKGPLNCASRLCAPSIFGKSSNKLGD